MALDADFSIFNEGIFIKCLCSNVHLCGLQQEIALWKDVSTFPWGKGRDVGNCEKSGDSYSSHKVGWSLPPVNQVVFRLGLEVGSCRS